MACPDNPMVRSGGLPLKQLLVVDDNRPVRKAICQLVSGENEFSPCFEAANGAEAVELAKSDQLFDLILMDLSMPVMNGLDAATLIRQLLPEVPIILLSMHGDVLKNEDLGKFGISALVAKDRAATELIPAVRLLLGISGRGPI
jgi:CheY-like chemotaxis protein